MALKLEGLYAVVTGSASGIGLATAQMLRGHGVTVFGFDLQRGLLDEDMAWIECDVTRSDVIDAAYTEIEKTTGKLDIVVNCAGIGAIGSI